MRDVIEEDHPLPYAAEEIKPQVTLGGTQERYITLICHDVLSILVGWLSRLIEE
jgi:hypothetical protein